MLEYPGDTVTRGSTRPPHVVFGPGTVSRFSPATRSFADCRNLSLPINKKKIVQDTGSQPIPVIVQMSPESEKMLKDLHEFFMESDIHGNPSRAVQIDKALKAVSTGKVAFRVVFWFLAAMVALNSGVDAIKQFASDTFSWIGK